MTMPSRPLPVVCTLTPEAVAARKADLLPALVRRATLRDESGETIRLVFPPDALPAVLSTIDQERRCCRFLRFDIVVEPDEGPISVTLSGPPGTRQFLAALIDREPGGSGTEAPADGQAPR
jgi:hypothetical protein